MGHLADLALQHLRQVYLALNLPSDEVELLQELQVEDLGEGDVLAVHL